MADLKSFINTSSDRIKSAMGVPVDRIKTIQGSLLNQIPAKSLATLWLDGTITESGGDYYFVDKIAGNNVLITGYDFPDDWTKGFPYKSAATIDVFGQTGVPVVSLFQNFDYGNQYFTRHAAQVVDSNDIETYEARVLDIVAYSEALTGDNLTSATAYYNVPVKITDNVLWIDVVNGKTHANGGTGTEENPYKTFNDAINRGDNGDTVYIKTGEYSETYGNVTDAVIIKHIGFVRFTATTADGIIIYNTGETKARGIIFNNTAGTAKGFYLYGSNCSAEMEKCIITTVANAIYGDNASSVTLKDVIFKTVTTRLLRVGNTAVNLEGILSSSNVTLIAQYGTPTHKSWVIKYCDLKNANISAIAAVSINFLNNIIRTSGSWTNSSLVAVTSMFIFKYNTVYSNSSSAVGVNNNFYLTEIEYNTLYSSPAGATGVNIGVNAQTTAKINNNKLLPSAGDYATISIVGIDLAGNHPSQSFEVIGNLLTSHADSKALEIGNETTPASWNLMNGIIEKNKFLGNRYFTGGSPESHGVIIYNQSGAIPIRYNYINGYSFGFLHKVIGSDITDSPIYYNISVNCENGISTKGGHNQIIINNTIVNPLANGIYCAFNPEGATSNSEDTLFKNNIIVDTGAERTLYMINLDSGSTIVSDYNIYYSANNDILFKVGGDIYTFAQWQALGHDTHSVVLTSEQLAALFTDYDNGDYSLAIGSEAIGAGTVLDADYDDGLAASTDWGSDNELSSIVRKRQGAAWDCGAYVH